MLRTNAAFCSIRLNFRSWKDAAPNDDQHGKKSKSKSRQTRQLPKHCSLHISSGMFASPHPDWMERQPAAVHPASGMVHGSRIPGICIGGVRRLSDFPQDSRPVSCLVRETAHQGAKVPGEENARTLCYACRLQRKSQINHPPCERQNHEHAHTLTNRSHHARKPPVSLPGSGHP